MVNLADLNAFDAENFVRVIGPAFEHSPWIAARAWNRRPFASRDALHAALCATVREASAEEKLALIRAHPDLVGRAILTSESRGEQASAGLDSLTREEAQRFQNFNADYRERFGFPFVICARLHKKQAILQAFSVRLRNTRAEEIDTALDEIFKIAALRLEDMAE